MPGIAELYGSAPLLVLNWLATRLHIVYHARLRGRKPTA